MLDQTAIIYIYFKIENLSKMEKSSQVVFPFNVIFPLPNIVYVKARKGPSVHQRD